MHVEWNLMTPHFEARGPSWEQIETELGKLEAVAWQQTWADYVILNRPEGEPGTRGISYMQTAPVRRPKYEGMFVVEVRDGAAGRHWQAHVEEPRLGEVFRVYFQGDESWREMAVWRDTSANFPDLQPTLPPEELTASYFEPGEWDAALEAKKQRDGEWWEEWEEK